MNQINTPKRDPVAICSRLPAGTIYPPTHNSYDDRLATEFPALVLRGDQSEQFAGRWRADVFNVHQETVLGVDLGCGYGHWLTQLCGEHPAHVHIGLDWTYKAIYRAAQKLDKREFANARLLRANAGRLQLIFGDGEVDEVYIYFPDPWPRKKMAHKRLMSTFYLGTLARVLKPGARLWFKTDDDALFEFGQTQLAALSRLYEVREVIPDLHNTAHPATAGVSLFEQLFKKRGVPIKFISAVRC